MLRRLQRWLLFEDTEPASTTFDEALIRTYLANERTFLAWLRSSVVLIGVGVAGIALAGQGLSEAIAIVLGAIAVGSALVMIIWAYVSFGLTTTGIERRRYRPPRLLVASASLLVVLAGAATLALLVAEVVD